MTNEDFDVVNAVLSIMAVCLMALALGIGVYVFGVIL